VRERRDPLEEDEDDLHRVPVASRKEADDEVEVATTFGFRGESWKKKKSEGKKESEQRSSRRREESDEEKKRKWNELWDWQNRR